MTDAAAEPATNSDADSAEAPDTTPIAPIGERVQFALRQMGLVVVALFIAGLVTERLRPAGVTDRGLVSAIFWWAILVWLIVLLYNAVAFDRSQIQALEGLPLISAAVIGVVVFVVGTLNTLGDVSIVYLLAAALGTAMFWWGALGLGLLVVRRIRI